MDIPLLAADWVSVIVGIIFLLVSAASAISNIVKEKNNPQPGKAKEKAALQKELEKFLQDAMNPQGQKPKAKQQEKPVEVDFFEDDFEEVKATPVPEPPPRRRRQQRQTPQKSTQPQPSSKPASSGSKPRVSHRQRAEQNAKERKKRLGGKLREQMKKKKDAHVESKLTTHIESKVGKQNRSEPLVSDSGQTQSKKTRGSRVIRSMLRDPQSFRQAIIMSEILSPPKSRRS